ncbi:hypothetical protein DICPUDRAFT_158661 [Dictyostelium purpureum]|uniref:Uncharacterized protein n=1 Tax=Dictyostelium purpureum TaxID=5786 RepID=F1A259_DICPU|nr:uncharacterized protein DICPUDRAFT_158661 [Dictyostelium purpureum]EGC29724.1 hypothetical protein DICPUDRAFT_158661 [Dictyostelium purpureum]|eukprot:XP_003293750.1 hypothetical protein DICPUDRAFT_158661 [Dictyostelium purpureum]
MLSVEGIKTKSSKIEAIVNLPIPTAVREVMIIIFYEDMRMFGPLKDHPEDDLTIKNSGLPDSN